jgi:hypothetical protein
MSQWGPKDFFGGRLKP